jgi:hypothetical protein
MVTRLRERALRNLQRSSCRLRARIRRGRTARPAAQRLDWFADERKRLLAFVVRELRYLLVVVVLGVASLGHAEGSRLIDAVRGLLVQGVSQPSPTAKP